MNTVLMWEDPDGGIVDALEFRHGLAIDTMHIIAVDLRGRGPERGLQLTVNPDLEWMAVWRHLDRSLPGSLSALDGAGLGQAATAGGPAACDRNVLLATGSIQQKLLPWAAA